MVSAEFSQILPIDICKAPMRGCLFCMIRNFSYALQFARHLMRQAVELIISEKEKKRIPTTIAPITLVAANPTAKRITAETIVPRIPRSRPDVGTQGLLQEMSWDKDEAISVTAR